MKRQVQTRSMKTTEGVLAVPALVIVEPDRITFSAKATLNTAPVVVTFTPKDLVNVFINMEKMNECLGNIRVNIPHERATNFVLISRGSLHHAITHPVFV